MTNMIKEILRKPYALATMSLIIFICSLISGNTGNTTIIAVSGFCSGWCCAFAFFHFWKSRRPS